MRIAVTLSFLCTLASTAQQAIRFGLPADLVLRETVNLSAAACTHRFPAAESPAGTDLESRLRAAALTRQPSVPASLQKAVEPLLTLPKGPLGAGDLYLCLGEYDRAVAAYQAAPPSREIDLRIATARLAQRRPNDALAVATRILQADPADADGLALRSAIELDTSTPATVSAIVANLRKALPKGAANPFLLATLARALLDANDSRGAQTHIESALRVRSGYVPALASRGVLELATNQFSTAAATATEMLRLHPGLGFARTVLAYSLVSQGRIDDADAVVTEALRDDPSNLDSKYQLATIRYRTARLDDAEKLFEECIAGEPNNTRGLFGLTEVYSARKEFDRALKRVDEALLKSPGNVLLQNARANLAVRGGRLDEGVAAFRKLVDTDPKNFVYRMSLAETFRMKGDWGQAAEQWQVASTLRPGDVTPALNQAGALERSGRAAQAAPIYERILRTDPSQVVALNNYANYLALQGKDLDTALRHALRAAILAAGDPMISDTLGFVYLKRKEPKEAAKIFERLTTDFPKQPLFHIRMANTFRLNGDEAAAQRECELARPLLAAPADKAEFQLQCPAAK